MLDYAIKGLAIISVKLERPYINFHTCIASFYIGSNFGEQFVAQLITP